MMTTTMASADDAAGARRCIVVGAAPGAALPEGFARHAAGSFLVAADGGYLLCREAGAACDLVVADYDSLPSGSIDTTPGGAGAVPVLELPQAKDDTDLLAACKEGLARGCVEFFIYGCLGGDMGHSVAAVQTLAYLAEHGARGWLLGGARLVYLVRPADGRDPVQAVGADGRLVPAPAGTRVGVFSFTTHSRGVLERGLAWELEDATLDAAFPLGASNEVRAEGAVVGVREGLLLVVSGG